MLICTLCTQEHLRTRKRLNMSQLIDEFSVSEEEAEAVRKCRISPVYMIPNHTLKHSIDCPQYWLGTDCDGRPVYIQCFTYLDGKKLFEGISEDTVLKAQAYTCECLIREILPACSKAAGKPIRQTASLIDFNDVSYSQLWTARDFAKNYLAFQEANYPDYLGRSYVINAPHALTIVWSMAQKILPKATVEKVQILGHDYHDQLNIPKESLPTEYGGTRGDEWKFSGPPNLNAVLLTSPEQHADTRIRSSDSKNRKAQARDAKSSSSESSVASFDTAPVANYS